MATVPAASCGAQSPASFLGRVLRRGGRANAGPERYEENYDMKKPITDRAEVSVDFPDKAYYGSFGQHSSYAVRADEHGLHIDLDRGSGEKRHVGFHIHYFLLADIFDAAGGELAKMKSMDEVHRSALQMGADKLAKAIKAIARRRK
jgi:hypothetical protein